MAQPDRFVTTASPSVPAPAPLNPNGTTPEDDRMKNAVAFLHHPKVATAPLQQKVSFLQSKGLTKDEICRAFRQIDPNSPDAVAIENGTIETATSRSQQTPSKPVASAPQAPSLPMYTTQQPMPMLYYPYVPQLQPPLQTSSRLPLYSALAAAVLAAGGGIAYLYRHVLAEKVLPSSKEPKADDSLKDMLLEIKQSNQATIESLQKQSEDFQALVTKLTAKIELLSTNPPAKTETPSKPLASDYSSRPGTLSPAVQALLETTPSTPATPTSTFDFAAANTALEQALFELESSSESLPAISVLKIYIKNLVETGSESTRYHRISVASPTYEQKVSPYPSAIELLKAVGFRKCDGFLVWQAPLGGPSSQDSIGRKQILNVALEKLTELVNRLEPREVVRQAESADSSQSYLCSQHS